MAKQRLFVDMDGTLARFHDQANYLERMFEKDFFRNLEPFENMLEGVRQFIEFYPDVEVYILSAKVMGEPPYCEMEKHAWLDLHLPEVPHDHRIFTEVGRPKAEYIPGGLTGNDFLLDDYNKGLNQWLFDGGRAIKCHNNINQRGLGAHGGQKGNMWIGPMVHVDDKPQLIMAELAGHMGLEYDILRVAQAYPDISLNREVGAAKQMIPEPDGTYKIIERIGPDKFWSKAVNPLNGIRCLNGNDDFAEVRLGTLSEPFYVPAFQLRAICSNYYHDSDYKSFQRADRMQLTDDVKFALAQAEKPIVGQIEYLGANGRVGETCIFHTVEEMKKEILDSRECGRPISVVWNVTPPAKSMREMTYFELEDKFYYEHDMDIETAGALAEALLKAPGDRTEAETLDLTAFWHDANPPIKEALADFLGVAGEALVKGDLSVQPEQNHQTGTPSLDDIISGAKSRADGAGTPQQTQGIDPAGR